MTEVIKSYVWNEDKCFFVSTIERESSAVACPGRYNETIIWAYDWDKRIRGEMLYQLEGAKGSIKRHIMACEALFKNGTIEE